MDPVTTSYTTTSANTVTLGAGFWITYFVAVLVLTVIAIVALWKMFQKAGKPGWASIVPFYNYYVMFEIAGYNGWLFLLMFVPIAQFVMFILVALGLAKNFGRSTVFAIFGLILFPLIGYLILGFGKDKYLGGGFEPAVPATPAAPPAA